MTEQQANYRDPTPNNFPNDYDATLVDDRVQLRVKSIRRKMYGRHVREGIASEIETRIPWENKTGGYPIQTAYTTQSNRPIAFVRIGTSDTT